MKPIPIDLARPETVDEALELLGNGEREATCLAGGQSLIPLLNFRLARPELLVSLSRIDELATLGTDGDDLVIGAMVRQRTVERSDLVRRWCPLLPEALEHVAHPAIRNRGTVVGSLTHADPSAELPAAMIALDARLTVRAYGGGRRTIPAREFFVGPYMNALVPGEMVVAVRVPRRLPGSGAAAAEVARRAGDFALAGAMTWVRIVDGTIVDARMAFLAVSERGPSGALDALVGTEGRADQIEEVAAAAAAGLSPQGDLHGSAAFRTHLAGVVAHRSLRRAVERARAAT